MHISLRTLEDLQFHAKIINSSRSLSHGNIDDRVLSSSKYESHEFREIEPVLKVTCIILAIPVQYITSPSL